MKNALTEKTIDLVKAGLALPLMEDFYTIQGEGAWQGTPAYFIRLAGCDVGCVWCDVKESWEAEKHPVEHIDDILVRVKASKAERVVITGGEPLMYDLGPLCETLRNAGYIIHIETSGAHPLSGKLDWICFSPKKFKAPLEEVYEFAHELKIIVFNKSDLQWAEAHAGQVNKNCQLYLQPEWSKAQSMVPLIIDYVKENPQWKVSLQTHKYMQIP